VEEVKNRKTDKEEENDLIPFLFIPVYNWQNENNYYFIVLSIHTILIRLKQATQNWIALLLDVVHGYDALTPFLSKHLV